MRLVTGSYPRCWYLATRLTLAAIIIAFAVRSDSAAGRRSPITQRAITDGLISAAVLGNSSGGAAQASQARLLAAYGKLPLSFERNQGQTDPRVKFLSLGSGYSLFLTANEAVLTLRKGSPASKFGSEQSSHRLPIGRSRPADFIAAHAEQHSPKTTAEVLRMRLVGANGTAKVTGLEELPGKSNHFIGNDPRKWRTNVPNYARVKYANVYPGVDLVYYGNQRQLEFDFVVRPGADPRQIMLALESQSAKSSSHSAPWIGRDGDLVVGSDTSEVKFHKPVVYQSATDDAALTTVGIMSRHFVQGKYLLKGNLVTLEVASYDKTKALVIDPTLAYSTYLGGNNEDVGDDIVVDAKGNAYVTGHTFSSDFPISPGAFQTAFAGSDVFVSKLNASGSVLEYSTYLGSTSGLVNGSEILIDGTGDAFVAGTTGASDFPVTPGAFQTAIRGRASGFITKINSTGSALFYSTYLGGTAFDILSSIALDALGNAYVTGAATSPDFHTTPGAFQTSYAGGPEDAFVSKLNATGSALLYSTYLGGSDDDAGGGIAVDASGDAYITGFTHSTNFPVTQGAFQTTFSACCGASNAFISKLNPAGSSLVYSTYLGGRGEERNAHIAVDGAGNAYVTGLTSSSNFPTTPAGFQTTFGGGAFDAFVSKLNAAGSALVYSTYLGGSDFDIGTSIALDASGNAYLTGATSSADFPITPDAIQSKFRGPRVSSNGFVSKLNAAGSALVYSTYLGGVAHSPLA
jgi:hypothetical protein